MKLVIIEAPFGSNPEVLGPYLAACIKDSLSRGESPIASVATFALSGALVEAKPEERKQGMEAGWEWYRAAELCAVYLDHGYSIGVANGIDHADRFGVPIVVRYLYGRETGGKQPVSKAT